MFKGEYIYIYLYAYIFIFIYVCLCVYEYIHSTYANLQRRSRKWAPRVSVCVRENVCFHEWVCVCVCMNIYIAHMHICWDAQGNGRQERVCVCMCMNLYTYILHMQMCRIAHGNGRQEWVCVCDACPYMIYTYLYIPIYLCTCLSAETLEERDATYFKKKLKEIRFKTKNLHIHRHIFMYVHVTWDAQGQKCHRFK